MKIGVIGATGKQGSLILDEAIRRGHEVTAIVRNKFKVKNNKAKILVKDVFALTEEDLKDFDVVVDAFGTPFGQGVEYQHQTSMMSIINAMKNLPNVRLLVVGGAASLFTDETLEHRVLESIPDAWKAVPSNMFEAYQNLRKSNLNWTYFSPAGTFDPKGAKTGKYKLGTDYVIKNDAGESYISYEDYAIAMVDEIENKQFVGRRFTAVSEKVAEGQPAATVAQDDEKFPEVKFEGLSQYRPPFVYELAGKSFYIIMDEGEEGVLTFNTGETLTWAPIGGAPSYLQHYECLKVEEDIYMVNYEVEGAVPRRGITIILDLEHNLLTVVKAYQGVSKRFPDLVTNDIQFGAIKVDGQELPLKRHGFTSDLVGKRIAWTYFPGMTVTHVYFDANYIRVPVSKGEPRNPMERAFREFPYDERAYYVKISDHVYMVSFLESHLTYRGKIGNNMLVLMNTDRLHDVGRSFGLGGEGKTENYCFTAIGTWKEHDGYTEGLPSKYRI
ncbi:MAG: NAD(P)H-binding protein [Lachnospiraceae bacterium]|nr:NAD(P)H-binding protein [Lachnospiraceae bacterium]